MAALGRSSADGCRVGASGSAVCASKRFDLRVVAPGPNCGVTRGRRGRPAGERILNGKTPRLEPAHGSVVTPLPQHSVGSLKPIKNECAFAMDNFRQRATPRALSGRGGFVRALEAPGAEAYRGRHQWSNKGARRPPLISADRRRPAHASRVGSRHAQTWTRRQSPHAGGHVGIMRRFGTVMLGLGQLWLAYSCVALPPLQVGELVQWVRLGERQLPH